MPALGRLTVFDLTAVADVDNPLHGTIVNSFNLVACGDYEKFGTKLQKNLKRKEKSYKKLLFEAVFLLFLAIYFDFIYKVVCRLEKYLIP